MRVGSWWPQTSCAIVCLSRTQTPRPLDHLGTFDGAVMRAATLSNKTHDTGLTSTVAKAQISTAAPVIIVLLRFVLCGLPCQVSAVIL
jgi:hypothetical protein